MTHDLESRLADHLGERAHTIDVIDRGVHMAIERGRKWRRRNMLLAGGGALGAVAVALAAVVVFHDRGGDAVRPSAPVADDRLVELPAATQTDAGMVWSVEDVTIDPNGAVVGRREWGQPAGVQPYVLGTAPHPVDEPGQQQLFSSADGLSYSAVGDSFDPWITSLDGDPGGTLYALGTDPEGDGFTIKVATSQDGGGSWVDEALPIDLQAVREELGGFSTLGAQVVHGGGTTLVTIAPWTFTGAALSIDGVDTSYGTRVTPDGVEVFGPPPDLGELAATECPPGWALVEGPPREFDEPNQQVFPTVVFLPGPGVAMRQWRCESPDRSEPDLALDPARIHGGVAQVVPLEATGLSVDSLKATRGMVRLFRRTADGWGEVELPVETSSLAGTTPTLMWAGGRFVLRFAPADTSKASGLLTSADGQTWVEGKLPEGLANVVLSMLPDGRLLLVGRRGLDLVAYTGDGTEWAGVSLGPLLQLDSDWTLEEPVSIAGPGGVSVLVSASPDLFRQGEFVVDHGAYRLRIVNQGMGVELLNASGEVLDALANALNEALSQGPEGWLHRDASGAFTVTDTSGMQVDRFTIEEVLRAQEEAWQSPAGQEWNGGGRAYWVLDTENGEEWAVQLVRQVSGSAWLAGAHSIGGANVYQFVPNGQAGEMYALVGRRA